DAQPAEGIVVEGRSVIEVPADRARISLLISGSGTSPQSAISALADSSAEVMREFVAAGAFTGSIFDASAPPAPTNSVMSDTATTQTSNQSWKATRELRGTIPLRSAAGLIVTLQKLDAVQVQSVSPEHGERAALEQKAIEENCNMLALDSYTSNFKAHKFLKFGLKNYKNLSNGLFHQGSCFA
ncbi:MAG: DUF541 domain-containing protein, partial [Chitinophagia bacterium]|nr:DUF541 domain-containing protein [Chitinophagia bacterium]